MNQYTFTLNKPATLSALSTFGVNVSLYRDGEKVAAGSKLSTVVPVGRYSLRAFTGNLSGVNVTIGLQSTNVPTRLQADVWGSGAVRLNWDDNSNNEASYRVDRWTHLGWRRSVRVNANSTAAVIDGLQPNSAVTYRVSSVTAHGVSVRSANIVSATTNTVSTEGFYQVSLSAGTQGEAGWTLKKDMMKMLPGYRDGDNKMKSKWVFASSWQAAVWTTISSWNDNTLQYEANIIDTGEKDADDSPIVQSHSFPSGGDFKVATGHDLQNDNSVADGDLPDNDTKYIVLEDSYGSIDHDYDDFYWTVSTVGIKSPEIKLAATHFMKQNNVPGVFQHSGYSFEGDDRMNGSGAALFGNGRTAGRTRQELTIRPMDVYFNDNGAQIQRSTVYSPIIGPTHEYDTASSVVNGVLTAQAKADNALNDGYLKVAIGSANPNTLRAGQKIVNPHIFELYLQVESPNPLVLGAPPIRSDVVIDLHYEDPENPWYEISGSITSFPCYEITIDGEVVTQYDSGSNTPFGLFSNVGITDQGDLPAPEYLP